MAIDRTRMMPARLALALVLLLAAGAVAARAQVAPAPRPAVEAETGSSFITSFPDNETYRLQVFGENIAEGLLPGFVEAMAQETRLQINRRYRQVANLLRGGDGDDLKAVENELGAGEAPHIAVVAPNMIYRFPWRDGFDRRFPPNSEARREESDRRRDEWRNRRTPVQRGIQLEKIFTQMMRGRCGLQMAW